MSLKNLNVLNKTHKNLLNKLKDKRTLEIYKKYYFFHDCARCSTLDDHAHHRALVEPDVRVAHEEYRPLVLTRLLGRLEAQLRGGLPAVEAQALERYEDETVNPIGSFVVT